MNQEISPCPRCGAKAEFKPSPDYMRKGGCTNKDCILHNTLCAPEHDGDLIQDQLNQWQELIW